MIELKVKEIREETADTKSFVLENHQGLAYQPGQFLTLVKKNLSGEIRRQYSFSSHPVLDPNPTITVKRITNGEISRWLFDEVKVGDALISNGASGFFTLPDNTQAFDTIVLLAAGSGITPLMSILKEVLHFKPHLKVVLIYSNHDEKSTIFLNTLRKLEDQFQERLRIEFLFSNAKNLMRARLGKSILEELLHLYIKQPLKTLAYVCGPLDYRQMAVVTLIAYGIPTTQVFKEVFHTPPARQQALPPETNKHKVFISFKNETHNIEVQYPTSILKAASVNGLELPYSCEAGRCGACAATCTKGEVWMQRNEVLTDADLAKGRILTCTGFPINGDILIQI
ncbi:MAG: ferredoxin--NADP reductase [Cytophagia bacterium]|nr:ferredoxin--NADP reductase [Cytophagia bacterium]